MINKSSVKFSLPLVSEAEWFHAFICIRLEWLGGYNMISHTSTLRCIL